MITGKFQPLANTANIATPNVTSQSVAIPYPTGAIGSYIMRVVNDTSGTVFIKFGITTATAVTTTSMPVLSGITETFEVPTTYDVVAAVAASTLTGNIYFTIGLGD